MHEERTEDRLKTTEEIANHYRVHPVTVRRWAAAGAPVVRVRRGLRFRLPELDAWLCLTESGVEAT
jgi:excisionase family DNA binding protein